MAADPTPRPAADPAQDPLRDRRKDPTQDPTQDPRAALPETLDVLIVGAGFAGIGAGLMLKDEAQHGRARSFRIVERDTRVGGTWAQNTYPGCACDVPARLYSFSFAPNPDWSSTYAPQAEIQAYLHRVAHDGGLGPHLVFSTRVTALTWLEDRGVWRVEVERVDGPGGAAVVYARVVVSGMGGLSTPAIPALPGLERFSGSVFHSQRWDHAVDVSGKRVAVIGTGASAIQFVPHLAAKAAHLTVFQRTPPWILPRLERRHGTRERALLRRLPFLLWLLRLWIYLQNELRLVAFVHATGLLKLGERDAHRHLQAQLPGDDHQALRQALTPDYDLGCKRVLTSNDYLPVFKRKNVQLVTAPVDAVTASGVVAAGVAHDVDVIVFGTGFDVHTAAGGVPVTGRGGLTLRERFRDGAVAYKGTTVDGFPNFFLLTGPNTGIGHTSLLVMLEAQLTYLRQALRVTDGGHTLEVKRGAVDAFVADLDRRSRGTVWQRGGCRSWYLDDKGRNRTVWPGFTWRFVLLLSRFDRAHYTIGGAAHDADPPGSRR